MSVMSTTITTVTVIFCLLFFGIKESLKEYSNKKYDKYYVITPDHFPHSTHTFLGLAIRTDEKFCTPTNPNSFRYVLTTRGEMVRNWFA